MCGVSGIFCTDSTPRPLKGALLGMTRSMRHRGPDDEGYVLSGKSFLRCDGRESFRSLKAFAPIESMADDKALIGLGHRRLSIIAPGESGRQPMGSADDRFWITFNGEIYNYREIARDLEARGVRLRDGSDTEVLLQGYAVWGADVLPRTNGMFAFAIWDQKEKALFCARDRLGIKPFYYFHKDGVFGFASDIKALLASGLIKPEVEPEHLYHALTMGVAPRPLTCFRDVLALRPGHWMHIREGRAVQKEWWNIPVGTQRKDMKEGEAVELVSSALDRAVRRQLVADVPVGTFMSGGIDSTTISALAARAHPGIKAFTLDFKSSGYRSELPQAAETAKRWNMSHEVRSIAPEAILSHMTEITRGYEEPYPQISPNYLISQFVRECGVTVVLNGVGGDELFAGYKYYDWIPAYKKARIFKFTAPFLQRTRRFKLAGILATLSHPAQIEPVGQGFFTENEKQKLFVQGDGFNTLETIADLYGIDDLSFTDEMEAISYMNLKNYIGNHHLNRIDQFTMRFSLEGRFPFLDHEVVEAAFRIPSRLKICNGEKKWVLREVARPLIPSSCLTNPKQGFGASLDGWMRATLADMITNKLKALEGWDYFKPCEIRRLHHAWLAGKEPYTKVWMLVATQLWRESFLTN